MTNNLIPIIAKELGVGIGEEFKISVVPGVIYRFTKTRLECVPVDSWSQWELSTLSFNNLINTEIIKLPFEPKINEWYWTYAALSENWEVCKRIWGDTTVDHIYKFAGCVFSTKEEAIAALPEKYKQLTGKKWEGTNNDK